MSEFTQNLILTIVDKLAIGLIVLLVAYLVNRSLEELKSRFAFSNEIAKIRAQKTGEIWSELYGWEAVAEELIEKTTSFKLIQDGYAPEKYGWTKENLEKRISELSKSSYAKRQDFLSIVEQNHFWVGEELYNKSLAYYHTNQDRLKLFLDIFSSDDPQELERIKGEFERLTKEKETTKQDIIKIGQNLR